MLYRKMTLYGHFSIISIHFVWIQYSFLAHIILVLDPNKPALMAESDAHPTGYQEVVGSVPSGSGNILSWRLILKYFLQLFSPFH